MKKFLLLFLFLISFGKINAQCLVPNMPDVTGGYIKAFEFDSTTNKLYIVGDFTQVGTVVKQGLAVIDVTTGAVLNDFLNLRIMHLSGPIYMKATMKIFNHKLYIGGAFDAMDTITGDGGYFFSLDLTDNSFFSYPCNAISDFKIYNSKIYTTGSFRSAGRYLVTEMDTIGNILWQKSISTNLSDELTCLDVRNNNLFIGGEFSSFNGVSLNNIAKVDFTTHSVSTWQPNPLPGQSPTNNCFIVENIGLFANDVLLNLNNGGCVSPSNNIAFYDVNTGLFNSSDVTLPYGADYEGLVKENDTSFWYYNNSGLKLYGLKQYVSSWSPSANGYISPFFRKSNYLFIAGSFTSLEGAPQSGLGVYNLEPKKPQLLTSSPKVCRLQSNVIYSVVPDPYASSYTWNYLGSGVTINGSGPSVSLDFMSSGNGTLTVFATNSCGTSSQVLSIPITVYGLPATNAGPDIHFTCTHTVDTLKAYPNNSSFSYNWTGPSYSSPNPYNQVTNNNSGGNYILTLTHNTTGCKKSDTLKIIFDTLRPVINHPAGNYVLTCATTSLTLDASANYPANDSLHWSGPSSLSQNNPITVNNPGNYILSITSGANGCKNKDSVIIGSNTTLPNLTVSVPIDTITCFKDSIQLKALTTNNNALLFWKDSSHVSLLNNSYVNQPGVYFAFALDTTNGCSSQNFMTISQFTTPPTVTITPGNYQINCSYDSTILNGSSQNAGAQLQWSGPNSFSSINPATVAQEGMYVLEVTNPKNGCKKKDSVAVARQNILAINSSNDTTICNGSTTKINCIPIGGTPAFTYAWNNGKTSDTITVNPTDTTFFIVTVSDNAGCVGVDTVKINVPKIISDSILAFMPCDPNHPNGQIQAFPNGGVLPYQYSLNGGNSQVTGIFSNLAFGTYTVSIKDLLGCSYKSTSAIDSSSLLPSADFILSTNEIKGDTFVIVDISSPRPDSITWILPAGCQIINMNSFAPQIINSDTGTFQITMISWFGACEMSLTKNIKVFKFDTSFATNYNNNGIKDITLYPNPNAGSFTVDISLYKIQTFALFIFDAAGNEILRMPFNNLNFARAPVHLSNAAPGTYLLKVIAEYDSRSRTFLITQ